MLPASRPGPGRRDRPNARAARARFGALAGCARRARCEPSPTFRGTVYTGRALGGLRHGAGDLGGWRRAAAPHRGGDRRGDQLGLVYRMIALMPSDRRDHVAGRRLHRVDLASRSPRSPLAVCDASGSPVMGMGAPLVLLILVGSLTSAATTANPLLPASAARAALDRGVQTRAGCFCIGRDGVDRCVDLFFADFLCSCLLAHAGGAPCRRPRRLSPHRRARRSPG